MKAFVRSTARVCVASGFLAVAVSAQAQTIPLVPTASAPSTQAPAPVGGRFAPAPAASGPTGSASSPALPASAPTTYVVPSVSVLATRSSNANIGVGPSHADTVLQVSPRIFLQSRHARWNVQANLRADAIYYVSGVQSNVVTPEGDAALHSEWVPDLLFFDAGMTAQQQSISAFQGQGGAAQGSSYTSTQWRVSPYIERRYASGLHLLARSDDTWTRTSNVPAAGGIGGGRFLDQHLLLEQTPQRLGFGLDLRQTYATYDNEPFASLRDSTLRGLANYALTPRLVVGLIGGRERVQAYNTQQDDALYGARLRWRPTQTGNIDATVEHRFFGMGWQLVASGGGPRSRLSVSWRRDSSSAMQPLGSSATASNNVLGLLNSLLAVQVPDPLQRARLVQQLLASSGLPPGLPTTGGYYTTSSSLRNDLVVTGVILLVRDSYALSLYRSRVEDLFLPGQDILRVLQTTSNDNLQTGAAFNYGHRLTPLDTLNLTLQQENDTGFGFNQGQSARQRSVIAQLDHRFSPRTIALVGVRRRLLTSTQVVGGTETAVFAGFVHRF